METPHVVGKEEEKRNIQSVDDAGNPAQNSQTDVDQEISTASALQEDTQRGQDDGEEDLADVTVFRRLVAWTETQGSERLERILTRQ